MSDAPRPPRPQATQPEARPHAELKSFPKLAALLESLSDPHEHQKLLAKALLELPPSPTKTGRKG
jgi:hypothetical protein